MTTLPHALGSSAPDAARAAAAPTIAAVVLNHDYADFVLDAVRSVLDQDVPFDEVVVVDDGSTDASVEVLLASRLPFRLVQQPNSGPLGAARGGLAAVRSDYVYFLDADDRALPDLVSTVRPHLADGPVKVQFPLVGVDRDLVPTGSVFPALTPGYTTEQMREDNRVLGFYTCPPTSGNVFQRRALLGLHLDEMDARESIDGVAAMVLPYVGDVVSVVRPLVEYRVHGRNHSRPWAPDAALLEGEVDRFWERWAAAEQMLAVPAPTPGHGVPLPAYVLERRLMVAALQGRADRRTAWAFARQVGRSHLPAVDRTGLVLWAFCLLLPVPSVRRAALVSRRSAATRPALVRAGMAAVRRVRSATG